MNKNRSPIPFLALTAVFSGILGAQTVITDDFTTPANWSLLAQSSPAANMAVFGGRMNFVSTTTADEAAISKWNVSTLPANQNWSVRIDAHLDAFPLTTWASLLIGVGWAGHEPDLGGGFNFFRNVEGFGIEDDFATGGTDMPDTFRQTGLTSSDVALRLDYDATSRTISFWFDGNGAGGGYGWEPKGALDYGPVMDLMGMGAGETFTLFLSGNSESQMLASGQASLDNLEVTIGGPADPPAGIELMDYYYPRQAGASWLYQGQDWDGNAAHTRVTVDSTHWDIDLFTGRSPALRSGPTLSTAITSNATS